MHTQDATEGSQRFGWPLVGLRIVTVERTAQRAIMERGSHHFSKLLDDVAFSNASNGPRAERDEQLQSLEAQA